MGIDLYRVERLDENNEPVTDENMYIRESYNSSYYATKVLFDECWASDNGVATIPTSLLLERLPLALKVAINRAEGDPFYAKEHCGNLGRFVAQCVSLGDTVTIYSSY